MIRGPWTRSELDLSELKKFVREVILKGAHARDQKEEFPHAIIEQLHQMGYLHAFVPARLGGTGLPTSELMWIARTVAYGSRGVACTLAGNMLALVPVLESGSPELQQKVVADILSRPALGAFCFTEPEAGSDILSIRTRATRTNGGYILNGRKCFITNASHASHYVVMAKIEGAAHPKEAITAFYIPRNSKGLSTGTPLSKLGHRDSDTTEVYLDDVFVPFEHCLGGEGKGLSVAVKSLERSRTLFAASAVGMCDRARDLVAEFLSGREHYGKPLLQQPQIRNTLAQLETEARAAWLLTQASACAWDDGDPSLQHSSMAKLYSGQVAMKFASSALELFGGWGYTREFEIERLFRDAKLFEIIEGPSFVQQVIIAKEILGAYESNKNSKKAA